MPIDSEPTDVSERQAGRLAVRPATVREFLPLLKRGCFAESHIEWVSWLAHRPAGDATDCDVRCLAATADGEPCGALLWSLDENNVAECGGPVCPDLDRDAARECEDLLLQALTDTLRLRGVGLARTHPAGPEVEHPLLQRLAVLPWQSPHEGRTERTVRYWRPCSGSLSSAWCHPVLEHFMEHFLEQTGWACDLNMVSPAQPEAPAGRDDLADCLIPALQLCQWRGIVERDLGRVTIAPVASGQSGTGLAQAVRLGLDAGLPNLFVRLPLDCEAHAERLPWLIGLGFQPRYLEPGRVVCCILQHEDLLF